MPLNLQAIKERIKNIDNDFEWEAVDSEAINMAEVVTKGLGGYTVGIEMAIEDAEFIAHARQDVPALIAEVERLRAAINETKSDLVSIGGIIAESASYGETIDMGLLSDKLHEMHLRLESDS